MHFKHFFFLQRVYPLLSLSLFCPLFYLRSVLSSFVRTAASYQQSNSTALMHCSFDFLAPCAKLLLEAGADTEVHSNEGVSCARSHAHVCIWVNMEEDIHNSKV